MMRRNRETYKNGDGSSDLPWMTNFGAGDWEIGTGVEGDARNPDEREDLTRRRYEDSHVTQG